MRKFQSVLFSALLASATVTGATVGTVATTQAEVHFKKVSFADAQKQAAKEKKKIMVDFYTDWCKWCKVLDVRTYSDMQVGKYVDENFIPVKIDAEKGEGVALAKKYQVKGYPTIVVFDAKGNEIDRVVGYQDVAQFKRSMMAANEGGFKALVDRSKTPKGEKDGALWLQLAQHYADNSDNANALAAYDNVLKLDPANANKYREEALYGKGFLLTGPEQIKTLEEALAKYPERNEARQAFLTLLQNDFEDSTSGDRALERTKNYILAHPVDGEAMNSFAWQAAEHGKYLMEAEQYAAGAVNVAELPAEKAAALDTKAEVFYREGRPDFAVTIENQALLLLSPEKDQKMYQELTHQKQKFEAALAAQKTQNGGQ